MLESKIGQHLQIQLDTPDTEISYNVERYIFAKVAELVSEQKLSEEVVARIQETLLLAPPKEEKRTNTLHPDRSPAASPLEFGPDILCLRCLGLLG